MKNNIPRKLYNAEGIYEIRNLVNGKVYIGSTISMERRYRQHKNLLNNNRHYNPFLQASFNKHGKDAFEFSMLLALEPIRGETRQQLSFRLMEAENNAMLSTKSIDRQFGYNVDSFERSNKNNLTCRNLAYYKSGEENCRATLTNEIVLDIVRRFDSGSSVGQISKQLGISRGIIHPIITGLNWGSVTGIQPRSLGGIPKGEKNPTAKTDNKTVLRIADLIRAGETNKTISNQLGVPYSTVKDIRSGRVYASVSGFIRQNHPKQVGVKNGRKSVLTDAQASEVENLIRRGVPRVVIAKQLNIKNYVISYVKRKLVAVAK